MAVITTFPLIEAGLIADPRKRRAELLSRMARDLIDYKAHGEERAAIRTLHQRGYAMGDIVDLVDDACRLAQETVSQAEAKAAPDAAAADMAKR